MLKRIMFFIPSFAFGGAERVTSYLTKYFIENNYDVTVGTENKKATVEYEIHPKIIRFYCSNRKDIQSAIINYKPQLIVIMFAPMAIFVVPAIKKYKIPYIISERNDPNNFAGKKITKILYQHYMKKATGIVFQTHDVQKYYTGKINGISQIIYNPLILDNFPAIYNGVREKRIVNVGRLHYQKNQKLLIEAFAMICNKFPEYILEIYGEGELRMELYSLIKKLNLEKCVFLKGNRKDVLECERKAALFVLSSDFEGMPNALIEALALGLPVISTDCPCGGAHELIQDEENGLLVPVNNIEAMAHAIEELLSNPEKAKKYSEMAVKIRDKLDANKILCQWEKFCIEIAECKEVLL